MIDSNSDNNNPTFEPALLTASQVARMLQISKRTLWRLRSAHDLPAPIHLGATVRWRANEIRNWIAAGCPKTESRDNGKRRNN